MRISVLFLLGLLLAPSSADAGPMLQKLFGCNGKVCIIRGNGGGIVREFEQAREEAAAEGVQVVIKGFCGSACALVTADSPNACVAPSATLVYHSPKMYLAKNYIAGLGYTTGDEQTFTGREAARVKGIRLCR